MPTKETVYCIEDCRVSATKQANGGGLDDQEAVCENFRAKIGWVCDKVFSKVYSGRKEERVDFEDIKDYIRKRKKEGIFITKYLIKSIDRFTRDGAITYSAMQKELAELGVELVDAFGVIQPMQNTLDHLGFIYPWSWRSPTASAQLQKAEEAKEEVTNILSRMIGASITRVQEGYKVRPPTDGFVNQKVFINGKDKVIEVEDPSRAHFFRAIFAQRANGIDDKEIVARINAMGYRTKERNRYNKEKTKIIGKTGNNPMTVKLLQRIIQKTIYAGVKCEIWTRNKPIKAQYDGLISIDTFNQANRGKIFIEKKDDGTFQLHRNYSRFASMKRLKDNPEYPYKNIVACPICRSKFLGSASTGKMKTKHPAYHCGGAKSGSRNHPYFRVAKEEFEMNMKNFALALKFDKEFLDSFEVILNDVYRTREKEVVSQSSMISLNVGNLKAQQVNALEALTLASSSVARKKLEEIIDELEVQIIKAQEERNDIEVTEKDVKAFVKYAKAIMEHPNETLIETDDLIIQRTLFGLVFDEIPTYQDILNGTPKLSYIFKLSEDFETNKSQFVTLQRIEL